MELDFLDFGKILNANNEGLTLSKIREERACLYIGLSTQGYGETAMAVGKLFLGELLYNSYKTLKDNSKLKHGLSNPISVYFPPKLVEISIRRWRDWGHYHPKSETPNGFLSKKLYHKIVAKRQNFHPNPKPKNKHCQECRATCL